MTSFAKCGHYRFLIVDGQPGDQAAIDWVAAEFVKAGLKPAMTGDAGPPSYIQPVPIIEYRPDTARNSLSLQTSAGTKVWRAPDIRGGFRDDIKLSVPLVFAGFGITAPGVGYDDYKGVDVAGKAVLVFEQ